MRAFHFRHDVLSYKQKHNMSLTVCFLFLKGNERERITFTAAKEPKETDILPPDVRLVDGPSILAGRLQIKHNDEWRSVCTNSRK